MKIINAMMILSIAVKTFKRTAGWCEAVGWVYVVSYRSRISEMKVRNSG